MYKSQFASSAWSRWLARRRRRGLRERWLYKLDERNRTCSEPVVEADGPIVSLTTFEPRWDRVYYTLESIGAGSLRPSRLILWVAPTVLELGMPNALQRLQQRGLEILPCTDIGPHKKYFPLIQSLKVAQPFVTCDDDILYPTDWLERLMQAHRKQPNCVIAHRVRRMELSKSGELLPYKQWRAAATEHPSVLNFAVGLGGVFYPWMMTQALQTAGDGFLQCAPRADDVWLKHVSLVANIDVCQSSSDYLFLIDVPGMRESGLAKSNVDEGKNDVQIKQTFTERDLKKLTQA